MGGMPFIALLNFFLVVVYMFLVIRTYWPKKADQTTEPLVQLVVSAGFAAWVFGMFITGFAKSAALWNIFTFLAAGSLAGGWILQSVKRMHDSNTPS